MIFFFFCPIRRIRSLTVTIQQSHLWLFRRVLLLRGQNTVTQSTNFINVLLFVVRILWYLISSVFFFIIIISIVSLNTCISEWLSPLHPVTFNTIVLINQFDLFNSYKTRASLRHKSSHQRFEQTLRSFNDRVCFGVRRRTRGSFPWPIE